MTAAKWAALVLVATVVSPHVGQSQTPGCQRSPFKLLRYEEDYRFLRNSSCRSHATDAVKYIDLGGDSAAFISFGGMSRHRYERLRNVDWGRGVADHDGYLLERYMLHADIHVPRARVFAEVASHRIDGRNGGPRPTDADAFDLHQAFVDVGSGSATLRFGRQEIVLGSERLVSVRDGPNIRRGFDGVRAIARSKGWQTDAFVLLPLRVERGALDNRAETDQSFWGMHGTKAVVRTRFNVDLYYLGLDNSRARFQQGVGRERRHSVGARGFGRVARVDYDIELVKQWGTFESGAISAWTAASNVGYTVAAWPGRPRFGLKADITSGDADPAEGALQTFNPLFPRGGYFGLASLIGPQNHVDLHPSVDLQVTPRLVVTGDWDFFWRESLGDGLYAISGALQVAANGSRERYVGHQPSLSAVFRVNPYIRVIGNVGRFVAGPFVKQMDLRSVDYLMIWFDLYI